MKCLYRRLLEIAEGEEYRDSGRRVHGVPLRRRQNLKFLDVGGPSFTDETR